MLKIKVYDCESEIDLEKRLNNLMQQLEEHCRKVGQHNNKPVIQKDLNGNFIKRWNSIIEAGKTLNINRANITSCCKKNGTYKTVGGFIWEYE